MGPRRAAERFRNRWPGADRYMVRLYGSLAATGIGHLTDVILMEAFQGKSLELVWLPEKELPLHPNGMEFEAFSNQELLETWRVYSIGGGALMEEGEADNLEANVYKLHSFEDILSWCNEHSKNIWEYVAENDLPDCFDYLEEVWKVMKQSIERGLEAEGQLPGGLKLVRRAPSYYIKSQTFEGMLRLTGQTFARALAVSEENAAGGRIVTAPTCGSAGTLPALLYTLQKTYNLSETRVLRALATAGLIGNLVRTNASISGAEVGCQGEIGTACSMAAGAAVQLLGGSPAQVEYAAEMGMEHHLGLTCDPVNGLVQIPCIERNAMGAVRAWDCAVYALLSDGTHRISFDEVIRTMARTGKDMPASYRETSRGGLAYEWNGKTTDQNR